MARDRTIHVETQHAPQQSTKHEKAQLAPHSRYEYYIMMNVHKQIIINHRSLTITQHAPPPLPPVNQNTRKHNVDPHLR